MKYSENRGSQGSSAAQVVKAEIIGTLMGCLVSILAVILLAALFSMFALPDGMVRYMGLIAAAIGALVGGNTAAGKAGSRGLLCGLLAGGILFALYLGLSSLTGFEMMAFAERWPFLPAMLLPAAVGGFLAGGRRKKSRK